MLSRVLSGFIALTLALAAPVAAAEIKLAPRAVVELFTSEGCSSCQKANALLATLADRADIVALAWHVDYWDYLGWPDSFGRPENTARQRAYATSWGSSRLFTPQMIVNGATAFVGGQAESAETALQAANLPVAVLLVAEDGRLDIDIPPASATSATIWLVSFIDRVDAAMPRGQNPDQTLTYAQIVTGQQLLGMWQPEAGARLSLPLDEVLDGRSNGVAILVQADRNGLPGPILGAATFTR
jgi:hypothetical protein